MKNIKNVFVVLCIIMQYYNFFCSFKKKVMEYKRVFSCSCFIDQAIWFVNSSSFTWQFDTFVYENGLVSDEIFIYDKKHNIINENFVYYKSRIIVCCLDCIELIMHLSSNDSYFCEILFDVNCDYTFDDWFSFEDEKIYYGNGNVISSRKDNLPSVDNMFHDFIDKFPKKKCCFVSLSEFYFKYFCSSCRGLFIKTLLKYFYCFENVNPRRK